MRRKFVVLQPYPLDNWERLVDIAQDRLGEGEGMWWPHYNPREAVDALISDHFYNSLGIGDDVCFGRVLGPMVDFEVAISSGCGGGMSC